MNRYTFVNTNTILFQFSSFQNFNESSFKTVKQHSFKIMLYNSNWYGGQYQDIQTALGSWYGPVEMFRTTTQGSLSILILHSISVTIVFIALKSRI
jgi:hypothetical protein